MGIEELSLHGTGVRTLRPLAGMPLRTLHCTGSILEDLRPFEETPPQTFLFDSVAAGPSYVERILAGWQSTGHTSSLVRIRTAIALRRGDRTALRSLSTQFQGRRYLFTDRPTTLDTAIMLAERAGAHLPTITSMQEQRLVMSLVPFGTGVWLDMEHVAGAGNRWRTGEPFAFNHFAVLPDVDRPGGRILLGLGSEVGSWFGNMDSASTANVMLEWEE
jgi:hypothetical protein